MLAHLQKGLNTIPEYKGLRDETHRVIRGK